MKTTYPDFRIVYPLTVGKSHIHGQGVFACEFIPARKKVGSLGGAVISKREARRRAKTLESIAIVELWNGKAIDASVNGNELRYINHSCKPNAYMRTIGYHVEFYALRDIKAGEELSCNYGETHHDGKKQCRCGAPGCIGFI